MVAVRVCYIGLILLKFNDHWINIEQLLKQSVYTFPRYQNTTFAFDRTISRFLNVNAVVSVQKGQ